MGRKKAKSPAQEARARYLQANGLKGSPNANIWFTKCPRTAKDIVLIGDSRIEHFYACEGDPAVQKVTYGIEEEAVVINGNTLPVRFDARVEYTDGRIELRTVGDKAPTKGQGDALKLQACITAAERLGGTYRSIPLRELDAQKQRIMNWRRALRFFRACKGHPLGEAEAAVAAHLHQYRRRTIGQLLEGLPSIEGPILIGALVSLLHKRVLASDLDDAIFSTHTIIEVARPKP